MPSKCTALPLAVLLFAGQSIGLAAKGPVELQWGELALMIDGHRVELKLADARTVRGEAVAVRADGLLIDVRKSTGANAFPKGSVSIPRNLVGVIRIERTLGHWGRTLGLVGGLLSGLYLGLLVAVKTTGELGPGLTVFFGLGAAGAVAGFFSGRAIDREVTEIKVVP